MKAQKKAAHEMLVKLTPSRIIFEEVQLPTPQLFSAIFSFE